MVDERLRLDILDMLGKAFYGIYYCTVADGERFSIEDMADTLGIPRQKMIDIINYHLKCQRAEGHRPTVHKIVKEKNRAGCTIIYPILSAPEDGRRSRRRRALASKAKEVDDP